MDATDVLIIGAGISGLLCASELTRAGATVRVIEKGRGLGGRMATRRMGQARLDHGAQFFTVRESRFQRYVDEWLEAGVIREWYRHAPSDSNAAGYPRYFGATGMTDAPKFMARDLDVRRGEQVVSVKYEAGQWSVLTASGEAHAAHSLVVTAPLPQALALLDTSGLCYAPAELDRLRAVRYERGLAPPALLDGPSGLPGAGFIDCGADVLSWIADNRVKGISPDAHCVTLHATPEFADLHWDSEDAIRGPLMIDASTQYLDAQVHDYSCHRWGYTFPINPYPELFFANAALNLFLAGDSFGGPRVEGAALSGLAVAGEVGRFLV